MKAFNLFVLTILFVLFSALNGMAQVEKVDVKCSDDKVIIEGKKYYVHIVKKGQTRYSISKAYNVSQKVLAKENPDILLGLRPGQALKIPFKPQDNKQMEARDTTKFYYHKVKRRETIFSLSQRYQLSEEAIKKYNPVLYKEELKARQIVKIPKRKEMVSIKDTTRAKTITAGDYIFHRVKKKETLWSLAQKYGVDTSDIVKANDKLQDQPLQYGTVIKIPGKKEKDQQLQMLTRRKEEAGRDTIPAYYQALREYMPKCDSSDYFKSRDLNVAVFLPFYISKNQEKYYIDSSETDDNGEKIYRKVRRNPYYIYQGSEDFIRFYEGMLVALDSLSSRGISINLKVFDTANDPAKIQKILSENYLKNLDLIIGPVFKECFTVMSDFARENQISIISPFPRENQILANNPYVIQIYPGRESQLDQFSSYIANFSDKNMILVHTGDSLYYPRIRRFKNRIFNHISHDTAFSDVRFKEVAFKDSLFYLEQAMNRGEKNVVIVPSENEAFVTDVVTNLNTLAKKGYDMQVFGYSDWKSFSNIELEYFYNINLYLYTSFYVNYQDKTIHPVIRKYRELFNTEPGHYAFHGFDISYYFFNALYRYGRDFEKCIPYYDIPLCHSDYNFYRPYENSGLENITVYILKYRNDLTIDAVNLTRSISSSFVTD